MHPQVLRTLASARTRLRAELEAIECNASFGSSEREATLHGRLAVLEKKLSEMRSLAN